jgi:catechol 2,3-dioxygenase-like lactoylglutathione lyase family enzyme
VAFPQCIIEQPSAAQILSKASLALDWDIGPDQIRLTADEIDAISSVVAVVISQHLKVHDREERKGAAVMNMKLEVVIVPVSDVDQSKAFYQKTGFRLDIDIANENFRVVQFTPPGSETSIIFGKGVTSAKSRSADLVLAVDNVDAARDELIGRGVNVSEVFHYAGGPFNSAVEKPRIAGRDPEGRSYFSFASFEDPDGNRWLLQEITTRLPGRIDSAATTFSSAIDLSSALRRAEVAHGEHEKRTGERDVNWPDWYAKYMVAEQAGTELPQ